MINKTKHCVCNVIISHGSFVIFKKNTSNNIIDYFLCLYLCMLHMLTEVIGFKGAMSFNHNGICVCQH